MTPMTLKLRQRIINGHFGDQDLFYYDLVLSIF